MAPTNIVVTTVMDTPAVAAVASVVAVATSVAVVLVADNIQHK